MKPRLDGNLSFSTKAYADTFQTFLATVIDKIDLPNEISEVRRIGDTIIFRLFFNNMTQVQRLRTWAQNNNLKAKLKIAVKPEEESRLTFHQCVHDEYKTCKEVTYEI